jgi:hypothetical protein
MTAYIQRNGQWVCKATGAPMLSAQERSKPLPTPYFLPDIPEYTSPIDGRVIGSRSERREDMKRNNCIDARDFASPTGGKIRNKDFARKRGLTVSEEYR